MKTMKGKLLKKLKTIKSIGYLKTERNLQVNASDGYYEPYLTPKSTQIQLQTHKDTVLIRERSLQEQKPEIIDVTELMRDLEDDDIESDDAINEKENIKLETGNKNRGFSASIGNSEALESRFLGNKIDPDTMKSNHYLGERDIVDNGIERDDERKTLPMDGIEFDYARNEKENIKPETGNKIRGFSVSSDNSEALESRFLENKIDPNTMKSNHYLGKRDLEDKEIERDDKINEKENISPRTGDKNKGYSVSISDPLSEIDISKFRRPDLDSCNLFDPNLLAAFEPALREFKAQEAEKRAKIKEKEKDRNLIGDEKVEPPLKAQKLGENRDPLSDFEEKCPPGGSDLVILYTTSLRSIRKTFEDCHSVRLLLESFRVLFFERDISIHSEYREELWRVMGEKLVPPCLFIKGRYIGKAERILALHEQGKLRSLFEGVPIDRFEGPCDGCGGARFIVCFNCNGSNKAAFGEDVAAIGNDMATRCDGVTRCCPECNENGLFVCPICC